MGHLSSTNGRDFYLSMLKIAPIRSLDPLVQEEVGKVNFLQNELAINVPILILETVF